MTFLLYEKDYNCCVTFKNIAKTFKILLMSVYGQIFNSKTNIYLVYYNLKQ